MQVFSICIAESTDITSSARLALFSHFCKGDELCEEIVALLTLPEHTTGTEISKAVINKFCSCQIDISKVVSITTDGTPSMTGELFTKRSWSCSNRFSLHHT